MSRRTNRRNEFLVGGLVLVAGVVFTWMSVQVGALKALGDTVTVTATFTDAAGLVPDAAVKVAGVNLPGNRYAARKTVAPAAPEEAATKYAGKKAAKASAPAKEKKQKQAAKKNKARKKKSQSNPLSLPVFLALCYLGYTFVTEDDYD